MSYELILLFPVPPSPASSVHIHIQDTDVQFYCQGSVLSHNSEIQKILKEKKLKALALTQLVPKMTYWHEHSFVLQKHKRAGQCVFRPHSMWAVFLCDLKNMIPKPKWAQKFLKGKLWICISKSITNGKKNICN